MDPDLASAPPLSVKLLQLGIGHLLDLARESGLTQTQRCLLLALDTLGGALPQVGEDPQPH